jgi:hypothetical protein
MTTEWTEEREEKRATRREKKKTLRMRVSGRGMKRFAAPKKPHR